MKKVVFLDRDGVINIDKHYLYEIDEFEFTDGLFKSCKHLIEHNFEIIIITNQSGIGRGYYTEEAYQKLTSWMLEKFQENHIDILKVYHCPHTPQDECHCRKPKTGMLEAACEEFDIDLHHSWLIGDKESDIEAAVNYSIPNRILLKSDDTTLNTNTTEATYVVNSIKEIEHLIK